MPKRSLLAALAAGLLFVAAAPAWAATGTAPGAPGATPDFTPANKDGFGTATTLQSKVWHTLSNGELTEVYYPDLGTPSVRDLQFIVSDNKTFAERETDATTHVTQLADPKSLTYRQINTAKSGLYRITKTYSEDPARNALLIDVKFESLTRKELSLYVLYDPSLSNDGGDDSGTTSGGALVASDGKTASALAASTGFKQTSSGYLGTSDGGTDLRNDFQMDWQYTSAPNGNVVQTARVPLNGTATKQNVTLALGFGASSADASAAAAASLSRGFGATSSDYADGWHGYLGGLSPEPASAAPYGPTYDVSVMTLAAHEDKTYRGGFIASPTMPWAWGTGLENPSGAYHLVWARDLYEIATALLAAGDKAAANRALDYLFTRQQKADGSFPQNSTVDGMPHWTNLQLDEVADPIILAWQLGRTGSGDYAHIKAAANFVVNFQGPPPAPFTPQERWENQSGYSPATIAAEIAGLICAADIARKNGDSASAGRYEQTADEWQSKVDGWTATQNGPYSPKPYYLRLTKDGNPDAGTTYDIGDSGPTGVDQRKVVDPSFLELVRLGVKPANGPVIRNSVDVVNQVLASGDPSGKSFWHRFTFDGYGEKKDGTRWDIGFPTNPTEDWANNTTIGRNWPIFGGERGEYELTLRDKPDAQARLGQMALAANDGYMIAEQVWAPDFPPAGQPGFTSGEGTFSATPLAWSHAQFVRLAWSIDAGHPVEQPSVVACRYAGCG